MDFLTAVKVVVRRWYVVLPVMLVSAVITAGVVQNVPPAYQSAGSVLLASPGMAREDGAPAINPFANIDYSSSVVAGIVAQLMESKEVRERLVEAGADPDYIVGTPTGSNAPVLGIESTAATAELSVQTVQIVMTGIQQELETRQRDAGGPPHTWIRAIVLTTPTEADVVVSGKIRALAALAALGLVAAVSLAFLVESIGVGRRRRMHDVDGPTPAGSPARRPAVPHRPAPEGAVEETVAAGAASGPAGGVAGPNEDSAPEGGAGPHDAPDVDEKESAARSRG